MKVQTYPETAKVCVGRSKTTGHKYTEKQGQKQALNTDNQDIVSRFLFLRRLHNPEYDSGLKTIPLRTCLLHHNAAAKPVWIARTKPKWFTDLSRTDIDRNTGEITGQSVYRTDCLTAGNNRKIKAVNRFIAHFKPMYQARRVSMLFYTFTVANEADVSIRDLFSALKKRLKRNGVGFRGYLWVMEISDNLHVHYHAILATDRVNCKGGKLPDYFKMDNVWGKRCQVEFITKDVRYYLANYFTKNKNRIQGKRLYGLSMPKK